jgi:alpha-glucosidase
MSRNRSLSHYPHHDGSELYLSTSSPKLGEQVTFRFRVGAKFPIEKAVLRIYHDGEPRFFPMHKEGDRPTGSGEMWWSVDAPIINRKTSYRFLLIDGDRYRWLTAGGVQDHDVTSAEDFQLLAMRQYPAWIRRSVFYQIFPDRFATTGKYRNEKSARFVPREWNELPKGRDETTGIEYFGGDLDGVRERLSHIQELGANGIYFTPFFPARSTHRYDASSFDHVDPLLGGDQSLIKLRNAAAKVGIKIMGDLTTNHCGAGHRWLKRAKQDRKSNERSFFYWDKSVDHGYEGWWGLASLPKLNYNSKRLRDVMFSGKRSIVKKWLQPPFSMAGWRIDVGNMTGRYRDEDINQEVIRGVRSAVDEVNPDAWLLAENADHFPHDLDGFGWHGTMNYQGFMRPIWGWLKNQPQTQYGFFGVPVEVPSFTGGQLVAALRGFQAMIPWRNFVSSMLLLDSHDTARFRNVVGDDVRRHLVGMGLLLTYPGVPSIFAGDEIGIKGAWGEDARRTIDWSRAGWDLNFFEEVKHLVRIRRESNALADGGLRWVEINDDCIAFLRESKQESLLIVASRSGVKLDLGHVGEVGETLYGPSISRGRFASDGPAIGIYRLISTS